jgi:membrane protease YdiL (CAAX protease family)
LHYNYLYNKKDNKMSAFLNQTEAISELSCLNSTAYETVSSSNRSITISTMALIMIRSVVSCIGERAELTGYRTQLSRFIPLPIRQNIENAYAALIRPILEPVNQRIDNVPMQDVVASTLIAPIVEEVMFRLPLLIASVVISAILEKGTVLIILLSVILSIMFTYAHGASLSLGREASLLAAGLFLSYLVLEQEGGLGHAILTHAFHNLFASLPAIICIISKKKM